MARPGLTGWILDEDELAALIADSKARWSAADAQDAPRADVMRDGLIQIKKIDEFSGRVSYEYRLPPGATKRSTWLAPHMAVPMRQLAISNSNDPTFARGIARKYFDALAAAAGGTK